MVLLISWSQVRRDLSFSKLFNCKTTLLLQIVFKKKAFSSSTILLRFYISVQRNGMDGQINTRVISSSFPGTCQKLMKMTTRRTSSSLNREQNLPIKVSLLRLRLFRKWEEQSMSTNSTNDLKSSPRWVMVSDLISPSLFTWVGQSKVPSALTAKLMPVTCLHNFSTHTNSRAYASTMTSKFSFLKNFTTWCL